MATDLGFLLNEDGSCTFDCHGWSSNLTEREYTHLLNHHILHSMELCSSDARSYDVYIRTMPSDTTIISSADGYANSTPTYGDSGIPGVVLGVDYDSTDIIIDDNGQRVTPPVEPPDTDPDPVATSSIIMGPNKWATINPQVAQDYDITELTISGYRIDPDDATPIVVTIYNDNGEIVGYDDDYIIGQPIILSLIEPTGWIRQTAINRDYKTLGIHNKGYIGGSWDYDVSAAYETGYPYVPGVATQPGGSGEFNTTFTLPVDDHETNTMAVNSNLGKVYVWMAEDINFVDNVKLYSGPVGGTLTPTGLAYEHGQEIFPTDMSVSDSDIVYYLMHTPVDKGLYKSVAGGPRTLVLDLYWNYGVHVENYLVEGVPTYDVYISAIPLGETSNSYIFKQTGGSGPFVAVTGILPESISGFSIAEDGTWWGTHATDILYSEDQGSSWNYFTTTGINQNSQFVYPAPDGSLYNISYDNVYKYQFGGLANFGHVEFSGAPFELLSMIFGDSDSATPKGQRIFAANNSSDLLSGVPLLLQHHILEVL